MSVALITACLHWKTSVSGEKSVASGRGGQEGAPSIPRLAPWARRHGAPPVRGLGRTILPFDFLLRFPTPPPTLLRLSGGVAYNLTIAIHLPRPGFTIPGLIDRARE